MFYSVITPRSAAVKICTAEREAVCGLLIFGCALECLPDAPNLNSWDEISAMISSVRGLEDVRGIQGKEKKVIT